MDFYIEHQLGLMMILGGISGFVFLFLLCMKIDERSKKDAFLQIAFFSMILLFSDWKMQADLDMYREKDLFHKIRRKK